MENYTTDIMFDISPGVVVINEPRVNTIGGGGTVLNLIHQRVKGMCVFSGKCETNLDTEKART